MTKRKDTITLTDCLRAAGHTILPREGGWVTIHGNLFAPRGHRIPRSIAALGVRHMDIYYGIDEEICYRVMPPLRKQLSELRSRYGWLGETPQERLADLGEKIYDTGSFGGHDGRGLNNNGWQATWITINVPHAETVRFFNGEVTSFREELIERCLKENLLEIVPFHIQAGNPVLKEAIREIVDALQVDGMSYHQATAEAVRAGLINQAVCPPWFYRPIGAYHAMSVED